MDAFTSEPFQGNPAAVTLLTPEQFFQDGASEWMQRVAFEANVSNTAFVGPRVKGENDQDSQIVEFDLRWFSTREDFFLFIPNVHVPSIPNHGFLTPDCDAVAEVKLCGHATLSTAVVLLDGKHVLPTSTIHFHTKCVFDQLFFQRVGLMLIPCWIGAAFLRSDLSPSTPTPRMSDTAS